MHPDQNAEELRADLQKLRKELEEAKNHQVKLEEEKRQLERALRMQTRRAEWLHQILLGNEGHIRGVLNMVQQVYTVFNSEETLPLY
jgi:DNA repair exonuclease SbcCD ATPase subunit